MLNIRIIKFTIGFALTLTASILYYILTKADEDEYLLELENRTTRTKHYELKKIPIPKEDFHRVLGKKGSVINHIRQATNTKINLTDYEDQFIAIIKGKKENVQEAEAMIQKILAEKSDFETEEIFVQPQVCGKIIGRNGDTIRHMCEISGAKIIVERNSSNSDSQDLKKIVLKGTAEEIATARSLIEEKLSEEKSDHYNNRRSNQERKPRPKRNDRMNKNPMSIRKASHTRKSSNTSK